MKKFKSFFLLLLGVNILTLSNSFSQQDAKLGIGETGKISNYHKFSLGYHRPIFRDFATSPLFHSGNGLNGGLGFLKRSQKKERELEIFANYSFMQAQIPTSNYLQASNPSQFFNLNIRYLRLWKINRFSTEKTNLKLGGTIITTQNLRGNKALQNNETGRENISNLMISGQLIRDVSRNESKKLNLLFFKPTLQPVKRNMRFQFNAGLLNLNYRPGYAYLFHSSMGNADQTEGGLNVLSWNGWRFSTELEFIKFLPNGNARSWSYAWDAANAPGRFESFQMASHQIRYTYYFQTKQK